MSSIMEYWAQQISIIENIAECFFITTLLAGSLIMLIYLTQPERLHNHTITLLSRSTLAERATPLPNCNLAKVFGVENIFNTTDPRCYAHWRCHFEMLLVDSPCEWSMFTAMAKEALQRRTREMKYDDALGLRLMVQTMCLEIVIAKFFPSAHLQYDSDQALVLVAQKLGELHKKLENPAVEMKEKKLEKKAKEKLEGEDLVDTLEKPLGQKKENDRPLIEEDSELWLTVQELFGFFEHGSNNPLSHIHHAYEGIWPIVLRCFLEVRFKNEKTPELRLLFLNLFTNPMKSTFEARSFGCISIKDIVYEALRLYPPIPCLYRQIDLRSLKLEIDIEKLHRTEKVFGADPLKFSPGRWKWMRGWMQPSEYMPFGAGTFKCPANRKHQQFGPMMIGVLTAVLLEEFDGKWEIENRMRGDDPVDVLGGEREPLKGGPDEYARLSLVKKL